jgi:hypothetical protein
MAGLISFTMDHLNSWLVGIGSPACQQYLVYFGAKWMCWFEILNTIKFDAAWCLSSCPSNMLPHWISFQICSLFSMFSIDEFWGDFAQG